MRAFFETEMTSIPRSLSTDQKLANWRARTAPTVEPYVGVDGAKMWICEQCGDELPWDEKNHDCAQAHCGACGFTICAECDGDFCFWRCSKCDRAACDDCVNISEIEDSFKESRDGWLICKDCSSSKK